MNTSKFKLLWLPASCYQYLEEEEEIDHYVF